MVGAVEKAAAPGDCLPRSGNQPGEHAEENARGARPGAELGTELAKHGGAVTGDASKGYRSAVNELKGLERSEGRLPIRCAAGAQSCSGRH